MEVGHTQMKNQSGIYEILNTVNGKRYVGSSVNMGKRWGHHRNGLDSQRHNNQKLQRAWNKYGAGAFRFLPILTCARSMLHFYEQQLLDKVKPEYNIAVRADSPSAGIALSSAHKAAISARQLGNTNSLGYKYTAEQRAARSARMLGNTNSRGNTNSLGYKHTPKQNAAQSARQTGKIRGPYKTYKGVAHERFN